jgi:hypothetical protein
MKYFKNIKTQLNENKTKLIGLLTILLLFWLILYFIPEIFVSLFNTLLGNLILLLCVILVSLKDYKYGIILALTILIIFRFQALSNKKKEGFTWTQKSTQDFIAIQETINPKIIFDTNLIQKTQASQEEVDYFNKYAMWPWSQEVKDLYKDAVSNNPYIRNTPKDAVDSARKIYNQAAILRILSYQTKEGRFLLNGVQIQNPNGNSLEDLPSGFGSFGYESGLIGNLQNDVIKCNSSSNNSKLEKITYTGKDGIYGQQTKDVTPIDYHDLEKVLPGFSFVKGPCNPCGAINEKADYSCPFELTIKNSPSIRDVLAPSTSDLSTSISSVWKHLWNNHQ